MRPHLLHLKLLTSLIMLKVCKTALCLHCHNSQKKTNHESRKTASSRPSSGCPDRQKHALSGLRCWFLLFANLPHLKFRSCRIMLGTSESLHCVCAAAMSTNSCVSSRERRRGEVGTSRAQPKRRHRQTLPYLQTQGSLAHVKPIWKRPAHLEGKAWAKRPLFASE